MAGLFSNFFSAFRIWLCSKQVIANVQALSPAQGARLALIVALYRTRMTEVHIPGSSITVDAIVQHPTAYRPELCYEAFRILDDLRETGRDQIRSYSVFKISPNPTIREYTEICDLALSLLMSTVGVGCRPATLQAVKYSWENVGNYEPMAADIAAIMKMPEYIVEDVIIQPLETDEWIEMAHRSPDFLRSELM